MSENTGRVPKPGWAFNMMAVGRQSSQKVVSEDLNTGTTIRIIDGVKWVCHSVGSTSVRNLPEDFSLNGRSSLPIPSKG